MELSSNEEILQMFRDFDLEHEEQRSRLLRMAEADPLEAEEGRVRVFIRVESATNPREGSDAKLA
jgi:hypothetical protein